MTDWRRPSALPPALLAAIAVVGVGVLTLVLLLLLNLFNGPGPAASGQPTARPSSTNPTATLAPGASATSQPTNSTGAPPTDGAATPPPTTAGSLTPEQALVAHVPEPIRATCVVEPGAGQAELVASCTADGGALTISYFQFADAETMAGAFASRLERSQIEPGSGRCEDELTWPAESEYSVGDQVTGRRLCTQEPGPPTIFWTDDRLNIMGQAAADSDAVSVERLVRFWTDESGPIP